MKSNDHEISREEETTVILQVRDDDEGNLILLNNIEVTGIF